MNIITLKNVGFTYSGSKKPALDGIDLCIKEGEFLAVMGENGSGKTTFCKLFNGLIPHLTDGRFSGAVITDGVDTGTSSVPVLALKTGIVMDDPDAQLFTSTVRNEAAFGLENLQLPPQEIKQRVEFSLSAVGLTGFEQRSPSDLSGGEKQRLAIACALAMRGKILVLDEPLCRLDPKGQDEVMAVLKDIREKYKMTIIMAAHDSGKMLSFADRVCILKNGKIAACDKTETIFANRALLEENGIQAPDNIDIYSVFYADNAASGNLQKAAIEIKNVSFSYEPDTNTLIKNLNLTIKDNDFICIIGRNGCGKTTLLRIITGLLKPGIGEISIRGKNTKDLYVWEISADVGYVMQNPDSQLFTDSVYKEVAFALKNAGYSKTEIRQRVEDALRTVGLEDKDAFPHVLSKQDRTKVVIACVLAMGCKIIILDEVDVGQDYKGCKEVMNIARDLHAKGFTIIFVTHNMSLVFEYAHRLIVMGKNGIISYIRS